MNTYLLYKNLESTGRLEKIINTLSEDNHH